MIYISTREIEKQIVNYTLQFDAMKDDEVEWKFQPPPFVVAFIEFIERFQRIPAQNEFAEFYIAKNRGVLNAEFLRKWDNSKRAEKKRALIARLARAYPSFVRDIYFFAMLCENGISVEYDPAQDVQGGVDLIVTHAGEKIQLHVFLDTPRSRQGRAKKDRRHRFTGKHLDMMLCRDKCKQVGAFWLPTLENVRQIKHHLGIFDKEVEP